MDKIINGLLIEDDPDDTLLLMKLMGGADWPAFRFTFMCAEDLKTGLKFLAENEIEVILLDLMLPDSQGLETVVKVRAQAPDIPIVVLTGLRDETLGLNALTQGAQDYQVKGSIDGHALKRTISYAVERHRALRSLKNTIESAPDGMVIVDLKGIVHYINPAAETLLEGRREQLLGKAFPYSLPMGRSGELKIAAAGGEERKLEARIAEIEWEDRPSRLVSIRDITELRWIEQLKAEIHERRRMDKLKDELMSAVSHEMRNPLAVIKIAASNLKEGVCGPLSQPQASMVLMQYKNILRLEKITDNILDLSRLESGKAEIARIEINAAQLIGETVSGFRLIAGEQNISIEQEIADNLLPIYGDPELVTQVLGNLLDNALRFARTRTIRAQATRDPEGFVQVSVIDDGKGIPHNRIPDLFNKFVQVNRTFKGESPKGYKGTGLGLAICKEIIERQQGKIWVESVEGQGAQFHFRLPQHELAVK